jgi:D-amino-acid dehydrogenase
MPDSVIVVGGGVVGLCAAYYAMRSGRRVTVLERGAPDRDACSFGNAGMIVPSHIVPLAAPGMPGLGLRMMRDPESPFSLRLRADPDLWRWAWEFFRASNASHVARSAPPLRDLHLESLRLYEELAADLDDFGFTRRGIVQLCETEEALHEEAKAAQLAQSLGIPASVIDSVECAKLNPGLRVSAAGGIYYPKDAHLAPQHLMDAMERALAAGGAEIRWGQEIRGFRARPGRVESVRTAQGEIAADAFVLAAGVWSSDLAQELGLRLPLMGGKGYSFTLPHPMKNLTTPALLIEARVAVTPMGPSLRFGGTMEITRPDLSVDPARAGGILRSIPRYFPDFSPQDFRGIPVWSGLRPLSPDGLPYLGPFERFSNLYAATGHAMMGVSLAPATGRLLAGMMAGEEAVLDPLPFRPDRYDA